MRNKCSCYDCGKSSFPNNYYMVHNELWLSAVPEEDGCGKYFLCISCLEKRLGRKLLKDDFTNIPLNRSHIKKRS